MKKFFSWAMPVFVACLLLASGPFGLCLNPPEILSAEDIMRNAIAHAQKSLDNPRRADYTYTKQVIVQELDSQGRVTETKEKLFRFRSGFGSLEQIKINGHPVDNARLRKEEERLARQNAQLTDNGGCKRDDHWEKYLTPGLLPKYRYKLRAEEQVNGRTAYVVAFEPRSTDLPVHQLADHLLNRLAGTVWIDKEEFEIVRAELTTQSKVTFGGVMEVLGSLTRFSFVLERVRLDDGIWFNRRAVGDFEGRKLLDNTHVKTRSETRDFQLSSKIAGK